MKNDLLITFFVMLTSGIITLSALLFRARSRYILDPTVTAKIKAEAKIKAAQEVTDAEIDTKPDDVLDPAVAAKLKSVRARYEARLRPKR